LREQGRVVLKVHVAADGRAVEVILHKGSGFERLDDSALNAVRNWRFLPAKQGSEAVSAWVIVPVDFVLRST